MVYMGGPMTALIRNRFEDTEIKTCSILTRLIPTSAADYPGCSSHIRTIFPVWQNGTWSKQLQYATSNGTWLCTLASPYQNSNEDKIPLLHSEWHRPRDYLPKVSSPCRKKDQSRCATGYYHLWLIKVAFTTLKTQMITGLVTCT